MPTAPLPSPPCSFGSIFRPGSCDVARGLATALASTNRTVLWAVNSTHFPGAPRRPHPTAPTPPPRPSAAAAVLQF